MVQTNKIRYPDRCGLCSPALLSVGALVESFPQSNQSPHVALANFTVSSRLCWGSPGLGTSRVNLPCVTLSAFLDIYFLCVTHDTLLLRILQWFLSWLTMTSTCVNLAEKALHDRPSSQTSFWFYMSALPQFYHLSK